mgnify:CR=1 FL=1
MNDSSPSVANYQLGRGILSIGEWVGTTPPVAYTDVGNCPKFEFEVTEEVLDHFSARAGTRTKDKTVILETGYKLSFELDEVSRFNLAMFIKGTIVGNTVLANTQLTKEYAIKFISDNPAGPNEKWEFWRCKLSPAGAFGLISDEWSKMSFEAEGLADAANHASSPYFTTTFETTTTTTTTTTAA